MTRKPHISYFQPKGYHGPSSSPGTVRVHWKGGKRERAGSGVFIHGHEEEFRRAVVEVTKEVSRRDLRFTGRFLHSSEPKPKKRGLFGKYKEKFSVGSEFFEPLSPGERKAWVKIETAARHPRAALGSHRQRQPSPGTPETP